MTVLLTGGAGFVGSHVVQSLLEKGHDVAVYDSFLNYVYPLDEGHLYNQKARVEGILDRTELIRGSTQDPDFLSRCVRRIHPTHIIHLAAMPLAKMASEHPEEAGNAILQGTMNVLQAARDVPDFSRFVYISSSMVYGDFVRVPADEDHPTQPKEVYGGLKLAGEILTRVYSRLYGIDYTIVRPSAVYGPTDNNGRVLATFLENALAGQPLQVRGAEEALDFTYVTDLAEGIVLATLHPRARGETFNLTRGQGRTLGEAAQIVADLVPGTTIEVVERDPTLPSRGRLDDSKARRLIGYEPEVPMEEGLARYLDYLKQRRDALAT